MKWAGLDAFTASMSPDTWQAFLGELMRSGQDFGVPWHVRWGETLSPGGPFKRVQRFDLESGNGDVWSGSAFVRSGWRGSFPRQFGPEAVNIEVKGLAAGVCARALAKVADWDQVQASRIDAAFDHLCEEELTPHQVLCDDGPFSMDSKELSVGRGQPPSRTTRYLHQRSERSMCRLYRRDWKSDTGVSDPTMRAEIEGRKRVAPEWWRIFVEKGEQVMLAAAAAEWTHRTGMAMNEPPHDVVKAVRPVESALPGSIAALLAQWGPVLEEAKAAGLTYIDLLELCEQYQRTRERSRMADTRRRRRKWSGTTLQLKQAVLFQMLDKARGLRSVN